MQFTVKLQFKKGPTFSLTNIEADTASEADDIALRVARLDGFNEKLKSVSISRCGLLDSKSKS